MILALLITPLLDLVGALLPTLTPPVHFHVFDLRLCFVVAASAFVSDGAGGFFHTHAGGKQSFSFAAHVELKFGVHFEGDNVGSHCRYQLPFSVSSASIRLSLIRL